MHAGEDTDARLVELETRLAFLEASLAEMSDALGAARMEAERNADLFRRAMEELKSQRGMEMADPADEPPPPHY
ncbi:SlyX family protein [Lysobacter sp. A6]|uniref:SlyX family protein n=1 Tax=Noviluteimonas lactosilytica TaxID=2888523 RepID=A0ABS8JIP3_9GAMM|nr:SlyX family protein [Lysobacter lactosilyticus]MCC8363427.1 SlyX family protein [Lysobacter lactosilyticus]